MMKRRWHFPMVSGLVITALLASPAAGQTAGGADQLPPDAPAATDPVVTVPVTPGDMARIRRALDSEPAVRINDDELRFYMQILVRQPTFAEFAKGYDFMNGPTRGGNPMTHNEFLSMVTPRELQSSVGITAR
jgi:hypothetical protein